MEFSWFHFDPPFLIKTNKIWTLDTKCEGGRASHIDQGPRCRFSARVLERPG